MLARILPWRRRQQTGSKGASAGSLETTHRETEVKTLRGSPISFAVPTDPPSPGTLTARTTTCRDCTSALDHPSNATATEARHPMPRAGTVLPYDEVGTVHWRRDLDAALRQTADGGPPVLVLFQEVPGCGGCKRFGTTVLSDPVISSAIEQAFVPVVVFNNRHSDAKTLQRFREPAWNYQVVRFLDGDGRDIIPRKDRVWTKFELAARMISALEAAGRTPPQYLEDTANASNVDPLDIAFGDT